LWMYATLFAAYVLAVRLCAKSHCALNIQRTPGCNSDKRLRPTTHWCAGDQDIAVPDKRQKYLQLSASFTFVSIKHCDVQVLDNLLIPVRSKRLTTDLCGIFYTAMTFKHFGWPHSFQSVHNCDCNSRNYRSDDGPYCF